MLENKEIRSLPLPTITPSVKLVSQMRVAKWNGEEGKVMCVKAFKHGKITVIDGFADNENNEAELVYRMFVEGEEKRIYIPKTNKITQSRLTGNFQIYRTILPANQRTLNVIRNTFKEFVNTSDDSIYDLFWRFDDAITTKKRAETAMRKEKELQERMASIPKRLPKDFDRQVQKCTKIYSYMFYDNKKKICKCSACGEVMDIKKFSPITEKDKSKCPKCKTEGVFLSKGRKPHNETEVAVIQALEDFVIAVRYFYVYSSYDNMERTVNVSEVMRTVIDYEKNAVTDYEYYFTDVWNKCELKWVRCKPSYMNPDGLHYNFQRGYVCKTGLKAELKKAKVLSRFAHYDEVTESFKISHVYKQIRYYERMATHPYIEHLLKHNLLKMAISSMQAEYSRPVINTKGTDICSILKIPHRALKAVIKANIDYDTLIYVQKAYSYQNNERNVEQVINTVIDFRGREEEALKLSLADERKLKKYLDTNEVKCTDYFDYIRNAKALERDMTSDLVRYPMKFQEAHDKAADDVKTKKNEALYNKINPLLPRMHELYDYIDKSCGLMITAPETAKDIVDEGDALVHCVGTNTHMVPVSEGKEIVLFVRKIDKPKKSLATIEINPDTHKVVQVRAYRNSVPKKDVLDFVEQYKKEILAVI